MKTIWKFPLPDQDCVVMMPKGAMILNVQPTASKDTLKLDTPSVWAHVDTDAPLVRRRFLAKGTGDGCEDIDTQGAAYIGTVQVMGARGWLVWHIFDFGEIEE